MCQVLCWVTEMKQVANPQLLTVKLGKQTSRQIHWVLIRLKSRLWPLKGSSGCWRLPSERRETLPA